MKRIPVEYKHYNGDSTSNHGYFLEWVVLDGTVEALVETSKGTVRCLHYELIKFIHEENA